MMLIGSQVVLNCQTGEAATEPSPFLFKVSYNSPGNEEPGSLLLQRERSRPPLSLVPSCVPRLISTRSRMQSFPCESRRSLGRDPSQTAPWRRCPSRCR